MTEKRLTPVARRLRRASTEAEKRLWWHLRARQLEGAKFVRQFPIGPYIADFACRDAHLVLELDGASRRKRRELAPRQRTEAIESSLTNGEVVINRRVLEHFERMCVT